MKKTIFVLLFCVFSLSPAFAQEEAIPTVEIQFPFANYDSVYGLNIFKNGIVGAKNYSETSSFSSRILRVSVFNDSENVLNNLRIDFSIPKSLKFKNKEAEYKKEQLLSGEVCEFDVTFEPPESKTDLEQTLSYQLSWDDKEGAQELKGDFNFKVKSPSFTLASLGLSFFYFVLLVLFAFQIKKLNRIQKFSFPELVFLFVLASIYAISSFVLPLLSALKVSSFLTQFLWGVYFFIILMIAVRFVPKAGTVAMIKIIGTLIGSFMFFDLDIVMFLTYTLPTILALEIWFLYSGYGKTRGSALGSALIYWICPNCFFWLFVSPAFYHSYFPIWYTLLWLLVNAASFFVGSFLGFTIANYLERRLKKYID